MTKDELNQARQIVERVVIEGNLLLTTPTRFGNGESNGVVDMTIARDPLTGQPLLPGASIAGALRSYVRTRERGFRQADGPAPLEKLLFGYEEGNGGSQSYLIVHDSLAEATTTELRDGVAIDPVTRTAVDGKKFDLELLAAGTIFPLRFELLVAAGKEMALQQALAIALQGFERGEIAMGARRRRGFGRGQVDGWRVRRYKLTNPADLVAWLQADQHESAARTQTSATYATLLAIDTTCDQRSLFTVEALFGLAGSLLIRSSTEDPKAPDMVHLHGKRNGHLVPLLSGTSLAGALRARALRIAKTIGEATAASHYIDDLFGPYIQDSNSPTPQASRLWVEESVIEQPQEWVVTRVKLDRFTGGSLPTALFSQQPVFGLAETAVQVRLSVRNPSAADKGLLLLLLKDLWTEDLPLGGEASVGRGRLRGKWARLTSQAAAQADLVWQLQQREGRLAIDGSPQEMQACVDALWQQVKAVAP